MSEKLTDMLAEHLFCRRYVFCCWKLEFFGLLLTLASLQKAAEDTLWGERGGRWSLLSRYISDIAKAQGLAKYLRYGEDVSMSPCAEEPL